MKKALCLLLALSLMLLAACGGNADNTAEPTSPAETPSESQTPEITIPDDPLETITYGRYVYSYFAEGHGDYTYFFHFYPADPVLGAVFYAGFANNGMSFAGTYTVEETTYDYVCAADREALLAEQKAPGSAPYTIVFYDWNGNEIDRCGFDGDVVYNDMSTITAAGSSEVYYLHDVEGDNSPYADTYAAETGVAYLDFVGKDDSTVSLVLSHNMTYSDLVDIIVEGTWSMENKEDGTSVFTLTPNDSSDIGATVTVSADRATAQYQSDGSADVIELVNNRKDGPQLVAQYDSVFFIEAHGVDASLSMKLYDDMTVLLEADVYGNIQVLDRGSYMDNGDGTYTLGLNIAGAIPCDGQTIHYVATGTAAGDVDTEMALNPDAVASEIKFSFTGTYCTFDCLADGTFKFAFPDMGVEETGTWGWADWTFTITKSDGNAITAEIDPDTNAMTFTYTAVINEQLADTFTCESSVWGPALVG